MAQNNDNGKVQIEKFVLPRLDWHDEVDKDTDTQEVIGRIYKDALIENFNAIEAKANEIQAIGIFDVPIPEPPSDLEYPDTDLENSELNQIINLRSLVKILDLEYYPIRCTFSGTTCTECKYYKFNDSAKTDLKIVNLKNVSTGATTSSPYIYIDKQRDTIVSASGVSNAQNYTLIGMYTGGKVINMRSQLYPTTSTIIGS